MQGLSRVEGADSESVAELLEEGNTFEAEVVAGVEAADLDQGEVHSHEVPEDDVPDDQKEWIARNKELAAGWKPIIERKPAPADADQWAKVKDKKHLLEK